MTTIFTCMHFLHASSGVEVAVHRDLWQASWQFVCGAHNILRASCTDVWKLWRGQRTFSSSPSASHLFLTGLYDIVSFHNRAHGIAHSEFRVLCKRKSTLILATLKL